MKLSDFMYDLPEERIAQTPVEPRDHSRLMVLHRNSGEIEHRHFYDMIEYLNPGDCLVINETRVIPARLYGERPTGGACEVLLLKQLGPKRWETLVRPGKKLRPGAEVIFGDGRLRCRVLETTDVGGRIVEFECEGTFEAVLDQLGEMPLPPYIHEKLHDRDRYQTVYAKQDGSAAAPTAGLHFTPELLERIREKGVDTVVPVLLHVGLGTFRPVKVENIEEHEMHTEYFEVSEDAARRINAARERGGRIDRRGHHQRAHPGIRRRGWPPRRQARRHQHLHQARLFVADGGRAHHQLPPARLHADHAGVRLHGTGSGYWMPTTWPWRKNIASSPSATRC